MSNLIVNAKQKKLFELIEAQEELIFAAGTTGISANLVGAFKIKSYKNGNEDRLDLADGTNHVHIDWSLLKNCSLGEFYGEGMLTFTDGENILFKFYKPDGLFPTEFSDFEGDLI